VYPRQAHERGLECRCQPMNHSPLGWIRLSPKSGLHANGSSQPSTATSMPCASNFALVRQPLGGFQFGTLHAYRVWRAVRWRSTFGWYQSGRWAPMRQLRPRAPAWPRGSRAEPPVFSYTARHRSRRGERLGINLRGPSVGEGHVRFNAVLGGCAPVAA